MLPAESPHPVQPFRQFVGLSTTGPFESFFATKKHPQGVFFVAERVGFDFSCGKSRGRL